MAINHVSVDQIDKNKLLLNLSLKGELQGPSQAGRVTLVGVATVESFSIENIGNLSYGDGVDSMAGKMVNYARTGKRIAVVVSARGSLKMTRYTSEGSCDDPSHKIVVTDHPGL
jgi:hypothetical protein